MNALILIGGTVALFLMLFFVYWYLLTAYWDWRAGRDAWQDDESRARSWEVLTTQNDEVQS